MPRKAALLLLLALFGPPAEAQHPFSHYSEAFEARFSRAQPVVSYTLRVDSTDLSGWDVELRLRNVSDTFRLAMAAHPEYDDRYWRNVEKLSVQTPSGPGIVARRDSAVWTVSAPGGSAVVRYRIRLTPPPSPPRAAWRPVLTPTGGLTGGPHAFMYVLGAELAPAHVKLELPRGWDIATGLTPTADPAVFYAPSVDVLVESPIAVGRLKNWFFEIDGVPHRVAYWPAPNASSFDTAGFVAGLEKIVRQAVALFGRPPYRDYTFIFLDESYGGLEHPNSVTLGAPSDQLASNVASHFEETAHEFIHTWNLMRIRPEEYRAVDYRTQPPTAGLWFSEGLTLFYADLLRLRAGLPVEDSSRAEHLGNLIARYLSNPGNQRFSAEAISRVEYNSEPGALGDYDASTHLQGEILGALLDLTIRDATKGSRSMDDVMRLMLERFSGPRGFNGKGVEQAVEDVCGCEVTPFFDAHVRGGTPVDFDKYLGLIGLRSVVRWEPATRNGVAERDLSIWGWERQGQPGVSLIINNPDGIWGKAGLHSRDRLIAINGQPIRTWPEMRSALVALTIGETAKVEVSRPSGAFSATVTVAGFERPVVRVEEIPSATALQRKLREEWSAGR